MAFSFLPLALRTALRSYFQKRVLIRFACYLAVMLPVVWAVVAVERSRFTALAEASSKGNVESLSRAYAEEVKATMGLVDLALLQLREAWVRDPAAFQLALPGHVQLLRDRVPIAVSISDAEGHLVYSDVPASHWPALAVPVARQRGKDDDYLRLNGPVKVPGSAQWLLIFTRPIYDDSGRLLGIIAASMAPAYLTRFYDTIDLGPHMTVTLLRLDGTVVARATRVGGDLATGRAMRLAPDVFSRSSGALRRVSELDGIERFTGWQQLPEYGLIIGVGQALLDAEAPFSRQRSMMAVAGAVVALLLALLGLLALGAAERRRRAVQALEKAEAQMRRMAHEDALTGLPNRTLLDDRLRQAILAAQREGNKVAVVYFDLDKFKPINDSYGHAVGDRLLCMVAERVRSALRESDTLARIGGDEFVVLLPRCMRRGDAERVATAVHASLAHPFVDGERELQVAGSVGLALYPDDGATGAELLHRADLAMYDAKAQGRSEPAAASASDHA